MNCISEYPHSLWKKFLLYRMTANKGRKNARIIKLPFWNSWNNRSGSCHQWLMPLGESCDSLQWWIELATLEVTGQVSITQVCSNSHPLSRWCHPTTSSSVVPFSFSSCLQSFPASGSFLRIYIEVIRVEIIGLGFTSKYSSKKKKKEVREGEIEKIRMTTCNNCWSWVTGTWGVHYAIFHSVMCENQHEKSKNKSNYCSSYYPLTSHWKVVLKD